MTKEITVQDGKMYGGWRRPKNMWAQAKGSIHDDEMAKVLGMRGGTVPGTVHLSHFAPLVVELWGQRWFESGSLSMFYTYATMDQEEVRAVVGLPPEGATDAQVEAWIETPDGKTVAKGTVAIGNPKDVSYLRSLELENAKTEDLVFLWWLKPGTALPPREVLIKEPSNRIREDAGVDVLDWFKGDSPWGGPILGPSAMHGAMQLAPLRPDGRPMIGFYGATEVRNVNGPIKTGVPYVVNGEVVCVGSGGRSEFYWYDTRMNEKETGKRVAELRHLSRFMKNDPRYQNLKRD